MFAITDTHIDHILNDLSAKGLRIDDLRNNLLDHICILAERDLSEGDDFEAWYRGVIPTFYRQQLTELEEETEFLLKYRACFAVLNRLQFFLWLFVFLVGPILCWIISTFGEEIITRTAAVEAWEAGLVFMVFPLLFLLVLFMTPRRFDPLIPPGAKILIGWNPFVSVIPGDVMQEMICGHESS